MSTAAELAIERNGGTIVARVTGELDMTNVAYIGDELTTAVPNEALGLVIDLSGTRYLDSAAIELLFELARRLDRRRQTLRLALPGSSPLRGLLLLTDVQTVAPLYESVDAALAESG